MLPSLIVLYFNKTNPPPQKVIDSLVKCRIYKSKCSASHLVTESWCRSLATYIWEMQKNGSVCRPALHFENWNFVIVLFFFTEHIWHHKYQLGGDQCWVCWASWWVIWLPCRFGLPLGLDWGGGSVALISNKCWTKDKIHLLNVFDDGAVLLWYIFLDFIHCPYVFQPQRFDRLDPPE
jgi:hypothetical protein